MQDYMIYIKNNNGTFYVRDIKTSMTLVQVTVYFARELNLNVIAVLNYSDKKFMQEFISAIQGGEKV